MRHGFVFCAAATRGLSSGNIRTGPACFLGHDCFLSALCADTVSHKLFYELPYRSSGQVIFPSRTTAKTVSRDLQCGRDNTELSGPAPPAFIFITDQLFAAGKFVLAEFPMGQNHPEEGRELFP